MFRELADIKVLRKKMDLTQQQLAKLAGVSQSLIAKIEAGKIDPTYTNAKKIFETLENISTEKKLKAQDVMNKKIVTAKPRENIADVVADMKKHGISQLPVVDHNSLVGFISETVILNTLLEGKKKCVEEIMEDRPPSVSKDTTLDIVSNLLKFFSMVAVFDKQRMIGIITKSDIIEKL